MAGRKKMSDDEKRKPITLMLTDEEVKEINTLGEGKTFSKRVKSLLKGGKKMESREVYEQGLELGQYFGQSIKAIMMQITEPTTTKQFRVEKLIELCVSANKQVPQCLITYTKDDEVVEYYGFIAGIVNGIATREELGSSMDTL